VRPPGSYVAYGLQAGWAVGEALSAPRRATRSSSSLCSGPNAGANPTTKAASALLEKAPLAELAWASPDELTTIPGIGRARAAAIAAAFEVGRRAGRSPPQRGERVLDPERNVVLMRHLGRAEREEFHIALLDVRGPSHQDCSDRRRVTGPVPGRADLLREAVRVGAHGVVFVHIPAAATLPP
jgi:DNA repair protein RadC